MTFNQIIYDIKEIISGSSIADDSNIDGRQIKFWIINQRALWIRNDINKNRTLNENVIQDLGCVSVEGVDRAECCNQTADCTIIRTVKEIPNPIRLANRVAITRVGPIDKLALSYNFIRYNHAIFTGNGKFSKDEKFAYYKNNRIYVKFNSNNMLGQGLKKINVMGIFENPEKIGKFKHCDGTPCYSDNDRFPIDAWMIDYMKGEILKNLMIIKSIPVDVSNDASEQQAVLQK